ncbi:Cvm1p NDAI_0H03170 [Naumovozyma dairenensis CBS 421]|uniref:Uncharacterized protein n=1 Tax=Naumovozyma dairenensis (strain ATCC 10597 / BCRC 20456 / CBS 421 / NBRC 0211 / NRRL Y-12639) TaxID=1071378 RepID=G0WFC9_NAUDC|nr:hypothetical protein NDAI_0H03170 [Naumovozyma dairenensis CBS 421]CCD26490.1 hypothetical protein NDAI_0H03170 [Naumovozyma dairenensis CBS 421]
MAVDNANPATEGVETTSISCSVVTNKRTWTDLFLRRPIVPINENTTADNNNNNETTTTRDNTLENQNDSEQTNRINNEQAGPVQSDVPVSSTTTPPSGDENNHDGNNANNNDNSKGIWANISTYYQYLRNIERDNNRNNLTLIGDNARYSQLNIQQIKYLEEESLVAIKQHVKTWCWFENLTNLDLEDLTSWKETPGILSVFDTPSVKCPVPLSKYPMDTHCGYHVFIKNSLILPSESPMEIFHTLPLRSKIATAVKNYYKFPNEEHLYLKRQPLIEKGSVDSDKQDIIQRKKHIIISMVGWLPEKYEKLTIGEQSTAQYLSKKLAQSLKYKDSDCQVSSLSFECPLDNKPVTEVLIECIEILTNWSHLFTDDVDSIFFVGVYHSVPLTILLAKYLLENKPNNNKFPTKKISKSTKIGILAIESCLQGYRFWDHSTDFINNNTEEDNNKIQQNKEKQLFQNLNKHERDILSKIKNYKNMDSDESKLIQTNLQWLVYNCDTFRLNLFGKLYDNFMTLSQKLAVDYKHSKILRNVWCEGKYFELDTKKPDLLKLSNIHLKTPKFESDLEIPSKRVFEITLINNLLLTLNLGKSEFVSLIKLISPFFISRSFNENTISPNMKKHFQNELKIWLQEMDEKWNNNNNNANEITHQLLKDRKQDIDPLPEEISTVHNFLEYSHYQHIKNPDILQIYDDICDDDSVYRIFIENTTLTKNPLIRKPLILLHDTFSPSSILSTVNQYDLVWKFHEFLSRFIHLRNLPEQDTRLLMSNFAISLNYSCSKNFHIDNFNFKKNNSEAIKRVKDIWETYQLWNPSTKGLKQLKNVLSVLSLYTDSDHLIKDMKRTS